MRFSSESARRSSWGLGLALALIVSLAGMAPAARGDTRGPASSPGPLRTAHSAPATLSSTGAPDSWFVVRPGKHEPLPAGEERVIATATVPDGRAFAADFKGSAVHVLEESDHERTTMRWAMFARAGETKKILGAHLFSTTRANGVVEHTIVFSNGACTPGVAGSWAGTVYVSAIRIDVTTRGRRVWADLRAGESITSDAKGYVVHTGSVAWIPPRAQFTRRFVTTRFAGLFEKSLAPAARAVLQLNDLVLPEKLTAFGTLKITRPREQSSGSIAAKLSAIRASLRTGSPDPTCERNLPAMGPFAPMAIREDPPGAQPGAVGGSGILPIPAPEPSLDAAKWHRIAGDLVSERMPIAAYDAATGMPLTPERWARGGASQGFEYRSTRGWGGPVGVTQIAQIPEFAASSSWVNGVERWSFRTFNPGSTCAWQPLMERVYPIDGAHLSRASKDDQASWLLTHDWAAWLRSRMLAADVMSTHSLRGKRPIMQEYAGQWVPYSLEKALRDSQAYPNRGGGILRELGWSMDALAFGGMLPDPLADMRGEIDLHARGMLRLAKQSVLPSGIAIDGRVQYGSDQGQPWNTYGLDPKYGEAPNFQIGIYNTGVVGLAQLVGFDDPLARSAMQATVVRAAERFFTCPLVPGEYDRRQQSVAWYLVTSENGVPVSTITKGVGNAHIVHDQHDLALAYLASGDRKFLDAMTRVGFPVGSLAERAYGYRAQTRDRDWIILPHIVLEEALAR